MKRSIFHVTKKIYQLGLVNTVSCLYNRYRCQTFAQKNRTDALEKRASNNWEKISEKHGYQKTFSTFFAHLVHQHDNNWELLFEHLDRVTIIKKADDYKNNIFDLLGSGSIIFNRFDWHTDFRLSAHNSCQESSFTNTTYYQDFKIDAGFTDELKKDIKVPWELARFYQAPILGYAYQITGQEEYAQAFMEQLKSWIEHNPYLLGIHWVCPMEVAIRTANLVIAFSFFKHSSTIPLGFWEIFVCSLYDHCMYLENNWELYDTKTNNHYFSNLMGYLFLTDFFEDLSGMQTKRARVIKKIVKELNKQVQEDGTCYEGSTAYHCLVTQMVDLISILCQQENIQLPQVLYQKLSKMHAFIQWSTISGSQIIKVGDDDSGQVIKDGFFPSLSKKINTLHGIKHFNNFGLSIFKTSDWHISVRQHVYDKRQPSGHFHNDVGSVTIAYKGIELFIDPGSYLYTASTMWRNHFRSVASHNTFYIEGHEPVPVNNDFFSLEIPCQSIMQTPDNHLISIHDLYSRFSLRAQRTVEFYERVNQVVITDRWLHTSRNKSFNNLDQEQTYRSCWNFILNPALNPIKEGKSITLTFKGQIIASLYSNELDFCLEECWVAPAYGVKVKSRKIVASLVIQNEQSVTICITGKSFFSDNSCK